MTMTVEARGRAHFVDISGRLTLETIAGIHDRLDVLLKKGARSFVLRLVNVADFSSTGIAGLLKLQRAVDSHGGAFALLEPSPIVDYVLELSRMQDLFRIYRSEADAVREFGGRAALEGDEGRPEPGTAPQAAPAGEEPTADAHDAEVEEDAANPERAANDEPLFDPLDTRL